MRNRRLTKKAAALLMAAAMGLSLMTGCGDSEPSGSDGGLTPVTIYGVTDPQEAAQIIIAKEKRAILRKKVWMLQMY